MQNSHRQLMIGRSVAVSIPTLVILMFTLLQFLILYAFGYTPYPDSNGYLLLAKDALNHDDLYPVATQMRQLPFLWNIGPVNLTILSLRLFNSFVPLLCLYALMKGLTAALFYAITKIISDKQIAWTALWLYVLYPANYGEATSLLSELPFVFFALTAIWLMLHRQYILCGMLLAVANWFRPMGLVFLLALLIWIAVQRTHVLRRCVLLVAGFSLVVGVIGNLSMHRTGRFLYQAATGWMALMQYSWDNDSDQQPDKPMFEQGDPNYISEQPPTDVIQKDSVWRTHFIVWLQHNPGEYFRQMPKKLLKTYVSDNTTLCTFIPDKQNISYMYESLSMKQLGNDFPRLTAVQWLTAANLLYYYLLLFTAVLGWAIMVLLHDRKSLSFAILCSGIIVIGTTVLLFFGHGESRFHIPFMPFVIMLSAAFISRLNRK